MVSVRLIPTRCSRHNAVTQERVQKTKTATKRATEQTDTAETKKVDAEKLKADLDAILDEIDEVLEADAVEFINSYVQKGGQAVRVVLDALVGPYRRSVVSLIG